MVKLESPEAVLAALRTPVAVLGEEGALLVNEPLRLLVGLEPGAGVGELPGLAEALAGIGKAGLAGETRLPTLTDRSIPVSYTTSAISWMGKSAVLVELRDETTTVETRQRLIQAETRFKLLTRSAPFGVWDQDRITGHWYFSPKVYALLGLEMDCTLDPQTLFSTMVVPEDLPLIRARTAAAFRNRALYDSVFRIILPDGALRTVRATGLSDHLPDGRVARFAGILQPAEEQGGSRHERDTASRSAVERLRAVLHTNEAQPAKPVNAGGPDTEEGMALSDLAAGSARPFLEIMDDLLELSGLRAGAQLMSAGSFNVFETLTLATERRCQGERCPLSLIIDPRANAEFVGYSGTWRRVVAAMLDHAIGRSGVQGVEVRLTVGETGHGLLVEVQDTGAALSQAALAQMFVLPGGDGDAGGPDAGWRIGFSLARQLAREMGGELALSNVSPGGAIARLYVPFERSAASIGAREGNPDPGGSDRPVRVLVAEDNPANQRVISIILQQLGCDVSIAENGHVCVSMFAQDYYDLVLMDLHMPVMDGYTATRTIRASGRKGQSALIVAVTADARIEAQVEAEAAGVDDFLTKPVIPARIAEVVARAIDATAEAPARISRSA